ncbi:hypothetical protein COCMIDRAFT_10311 [Bipolaris oryzae ATCC 44560]|uniref:Uncharacterized protein n=1 Tax=Bipolaris oryzae ATCC 44560 TaxID=930090 RepID=W6YQ19_COCMI|nr:uncharacterized protein COCMIDRAFT_10311 [Bipolaris oryzae ATCC 44560]EUC39613.1 hypothetical protein COCMIDRAFT_10311 [Bipolaris oryzae ATCC 44560]
MLSRTRGREGGQGIIDVVLKRQGLALDLDPGGRAVPRLPLLVSKSKLKLTAITIRQAGVDRRS